jgi:hypothetical protein
MDALAQETRRHDVTDWITDVLGSVAQVRDEGASVSTGSHA